MSDPVEQLSALVRDARRIVVFTGAGISTESGIPDFRSPGGVWTKYDPSEFHIDRFLASPESRRRYWMRVTEFYQEIAKAMPNAAHYAVAQLEKLGKLGAVITQNVDGLHQLAGSAPENVVEVHGSHRAVSCLQCGHSHPRARFQEWVTPEGQAPDCEKCGGLMKPATISFGQMLKPEVLERASEEAQNCDLFLVVGSSLVVYPAAGLPLLAVRNGATLAIVNREETPHDEYAGVVVRASAGETLTQVLKAVAPEGAAPLPRPN
ncbi:MAG TPA: Sir2 family NAD-dependent protein deacetylase [bacterium]